MLSFYLQELIWSGYLFTTIEQWRRQVILLHIHKMNYKFNVFSTKTTNGILPRKKTIPIPKATQETKTNPNDFEQKRAKLEPSYFLTWRYIAKCFCQGRCKEQGNKIKAFYVFAADGIFSVC